MSNRHVSFVLRCQSDLRTVLSSDWRLSRVLLVSRGAHLGNRLAAEVALTNWGLICSRVQVQVQLWQLKLFTVLLARG